MSEDLSHDAHLRAALRHAPDHALAPPAGVSQTILNAARHVHKPVRPAATPGPAVRVTVAPPRAIAWLRQWFASPRLAGGLATGLVAALGLGLWIDLGREPVFDRAPVPAANEVRVGEAAPAAREPALEPAATAKNDARDAPATPAAPTAAVEATRAKRAPRVAEAKVEREPVEPPRPAPAAVPLRREAEQQRDAEGALAKSAPVEAAPPAVAPAQAAANTAPRDATERSDSRMSLAARGAAALAGARTAEGVASAAPALTLLTRARAESANGIARWTWLPPGKAAIVPVDGAAQEWLARVAQAARTHWIDTSESAGAGDALEVRWWRDDWPQATLRIEAEGLRWIEHNGRMRYAPLDPATLQRLRSL